MQLKGTHAASWLVAQQHLHDSLSAFTNQPWPRYFPAACFPKRCNSPTWSWLGLSTPSLWWGSGPGTQYLTWLGGLSSASRMDLVYRWEQFYPWGSKENRVLVTIEMEVIWIQFFPPGTSAQMTELITLTWALIMGKGLAVNIYRNIRYAFATAHVHKAIYPEWGLLTVEGRSKIKMKFYNSLKPSGYQKKKRKRKKKAIIHCPRYQKGTALVARGNDLADKAAREVALQETATSVLATDLTEPSRATNIYRRGN